MSSPSASGRVATARCGTGADTGTTAEADFGRALLETTTEAWETAEGGRPRPWRGLEAEAERGRGEGGSGRTESGAIGGSKRTATVSPVRVTNSIRLAIPPW